MEDKSVIEKAAEFFETDVRFAQIMNVTPQAIGKWKRTKVPAERCIDIEMKTNGLVNRYQLRPDVFGEEQAANG